MTDDLHPHVQVTREGDSWIVEIDDGTQIWIPIATERVRENADSIAMALSDAIRRAERRALDEVEEFIGRAGEAERIVESARLRLACVAESMTEHAYQELASALEAPPRPR